MKNNQKAHQCLCSIMKSSTVFQSFIPKLCAVPSGIKHAKAGQAIAGLSTLHGKTWIKKFMYGPLSKKLPDCRILQMPPKLKSTSHPLPLLKTMLQALDLTAQSSTSCCCSCPSLEDCLPLALCILYTFWTSIEYFYKRLGFAFNHKGCVPHAYLLIKNKANQLNGEIKVRTMYSYAKHPLRKLAKVIGRCLTMFIKQITQNIPCFELINMN